MLREHIIFAKVCHVQLCQRTFEDQLESCQSSNSCHSPLNFCHSNKKGKNLQNTVLENEIGKCIINSDSNSNKFELRKVLV